MDNQELLTKVNKIIEELTTIRKSLVKNDIVDLSDNAIYLGITFASKLYGINSLLNDEFIKKFHLETLVKAIDENMVKLQASHYQDKPTFYIFFNTLYNQVTYRFNQINYYYSLSDDDRDKLVVTKEYYQYLYTLLKNSLEENSSTHEDEIKEILEIINLYKVIDDKKKVALGSNVIYTDFGTNSTFEYKIVIPSHEKIEHKKISYLHVYPLLNHQENEMILINPSVSQFIKIESVKNEEEKPHL